MSATRDQSDYRADIDGLRAIAVLSVMLFHANEALLPGGFLGVDIFFVISGYLISKHIAAEAASGKFSLLEFYRRRIRRIMPMMLVVITATLAASLVIMTPDDARAVAKSSVWSIVSMANVHFWRDLDTGYFANSSAEVPLLHLWSLGVEEQFYLLWPLVLLVAVRRLSPYVLLVTITVVAGLSFELASRTFPIDASFAYYLLPTRMGELLLGALLGVGVAIAPWRQAPRAGQVAGWIGVALVFSSMWVIDRRDPFPSWLALPPTVGAVLMILAGEQRPHPVFWLSSRPMVSVGKISYSAYLWHWPLFAFYRYGYGEPGMAACFTILIATLLLAWLSYHIVERPTRRATGSFRVVAVRQFLAPALVLLVPSLLVAFASRINLPLASADYLAQLKRVREANRPAFTFDWVCQRQRLSPADLSDPRCVLGAPGAEAPRGVLWGDSNAAHYVSMVNEIATHAGVRFRNFALGSCPPLLADPRPYVEARRVSDCVASAALVREEIERYPVVLISAAWSGYMANGPKFIDDLESLLHALAQRGHAIVLIGSAPVIDGYDRRCDEKALRVPFKGCPDLAEPLSERVVRANNALRVLAGRVAGVSFFDPTPYLCPGNRCATRTADGQPRYLDAIHLTMPGSRELGQMIVSAEGTPLPFAPLVR